MLGCINAQPEPVRYLFNALFRLIILAAILILPPTFASAQNAISISASSSLNFGTLSRSSSSEIDYGAGGAARFLVTGDSARDVRLTISTSELIAQSGSSTNALDRVFDPTITNSDCAYSLDGGSSWHPFSSGTLYQDTRFPNDESGVGAIHVRIGGSLISSARQQRGGYSGMITLTAEYR